MANRKYQESYIHFKPDDPPHFLILSNNKCIMCITDQFDKPVVRQRVFKTALNAISHRIGFNVDFCRTFRLILFNDYILPHILNASILEIIPNRPSQIGWHSIIQKCSSNGHPRERERERERALIMSNNSVNSPPPLNIVISNIVLY